MEGLKDVVEVEVQRRVIAEEDMVERRVRAENDMITNWEESQIRAEGKLMWWTVSCWCVVNRNRYITL